MPRLRRVLALSLLAAALVPLRSSAAPAAPHPGADPAQVALVTGHVRSLQDYVRRGMTPAQAVRIRLLDTLAASGVPLRSVQQYATVARRAAPDPTALLCDVTSFGAVFVFTVSYYGDLLPAGDLDGDGRPDVVESVEVPRTKTTSTWVVHARDARTGRVLWTHRAVHDQYHGGVAIPMVLGARPRPGVLLVTYGARDTKVPLGLRLALSQDLQAVDGRDRPLWSHQASGTMTFGFEGNSYQHAPLGLEIAKLRHGAEDALVTTYDGDESTGVTGSLDRVGGGSGRVDHPVPSLSSTATSLLGSVEDGLLGGSDGSLPYLGTVPDQDGDRLTDLYSARVGSNHVISVYGGVRGTPVWSSQLLPLYGYLDVTDAGVLTQPEARLHDLALTSGLPGNSGFSAPLGLLPDLDGTVVLAGAGTGSLVWVRPGEQAYPLGEVGGKAVLGTATSTSQQTADGFTLDEQLVVYDELGVPQSRRDYTFTLHDKGCSFGTSTLLMYLGDLDGDRAQEAQVWFLAFVQDDDKHPLRQQFTTVRGSDGKELDHSRSYSLGGAVDGHGIDRVVPTLGSRQVSVKVLHGDTLKPLWSAALPVADDVWALDSYAMDESPTGCSDVALLGYGKQSRSTALLASNGKAWWRVVYAPRQTEGRLEHDRGARELC